VEDPVFLVELEISPEETTELLGTSAGAAPCLETLGTRMRRACRRSGRSRGCGRRTELTRLFMKRLQRPYSQPVWEDQYGKRIEVLVQSRFPDDWRGYGAFRMSDHCIGTPVSRHRAAAVRSVLAPADIESGPAFTGRNTKPRASVSQEWPLAFSQRVWIQYARNAARMLYHIDIGLVALQNGFHTGYRRDFWTELSQSRKSEKVGRPQTRGAYSTRFWPCRRRCAARPSLRPGGDQGRVVRLNTAGTLCRSPGQFCRCARIEIDSASTVWIGGGARSITGSAVSKQRRTFRRE